MQIAVALAVALFAETSLPREIRSVRGPAWVTYSTALVSGQHRMCEEEHHYDRIVKLEGPRELRIFLRVVDGSVEKVRAFTEGCTVDAGGLPVVTLTGVSAAESLDFLRSLVPSLDRDGAITAIALHADKEADRVLEGFVAAGQPEKVREKASFWLGAARSVRGYEILDRVVRDDSDARFREKVVFALYVSPAPQATPSIIRVAKSDRSARVRGQALFWLAQKAGHEAAAAITDAIENDPETDVKKKAVFALSQLPSSEGVPLLIQVARTQKNPAVRKQAMFWLGQSKDEKALAFFEEVLKP